MFQLASIKSHNCNCQKALNVKKMMEDRNGVTDDINADVNGQVASGWLVGSYISRGTELEGGELLSHTIG